MHREFLFPYRVLFALWRKRSSSKRNIIPPTCLWTDLFVLLGFFSPSWMPASGSCKSTSLAEVRAGSQPPVCHALSAPQPAQVDHCHWWACGDSFYSKVNWSWTVSSMSWAQHCFSSSPRFYVSLLPIFFFPFSFKQIQTLLLMQGKFHFLLKGLC